MKIEPVAREKKILFWVLAALALIVLALSPFAFHAKRAAAEWVNPSTVFAQERTNTYYASQFPGPDVTTKITNAQGACSNSPALTCVIVIDAILGGWPQGSGATPCSHCIWVDWSATTSLTFYGPSSSTNAVTIGNGNIFISSALLPTVNGGAALGTLTARFQQLNMGDASGGVRWLANGAYTGNRQLTVPDGDSGTVIRNSFTTTAATTDNVAMQGGTNLSRCSVTPTNAAAAGGIASVFISNKTTNQITVTHTATAGWTFDVMCTSF